MTAEGFNLIGEHRGFTLALTWETPSEPHSSSNKRKRCCQGLPSSTSRSSYPYFHRSGGILVGPADGGIDVDMPGDQALGVCLGLEPGEDPRPGAVPLPAPEQVIDPVPRPITFGHVPPQEAPVRVATVCWFSP